MKYELGQITAELFNQNLISKIELAEFHAQDRALELLYKHKLEKIKKGKELSILRLEILNSKTEELEKLNEKLLELKKNHLKNERKQQFIRKIKENLSYIHGEICRELVENYGNILSLELKKELLALGLKEE